MGEAGSRCFLEETKTKEKVGARENWGAAEEAGEFSSLLSCSQGHYESWEGTKSEKSGAYQLVGFLHGKNLSFVVRLRCCNVPWNG